MSGERGEIDVKPWVGIQELGLTELVGKDEALAQSRFCASVGVTLAHPASGIIRALSFYSSESGSGAVIVPAGTLFVFDADPVVTLADAALTAAAWQKCLYYLTIATADWLSDAGGGIRCFVNQYIPFHSVASLYFVFYMTSATPINDAAGDDELLQFNAWYERQS
jgi:hypothetical protein